MNKELLPGPNLTTQLVGVLTKVTLIDDIEATFYQVHIIPETRFRY